MFLYNLINNKINYQILLEINSSNTPNKDTFFILTINTNYSLLSTDTLLMSVGIYVET